MGNGIAQVCAAAGLSVVMVDVSQAALERGMKTIGSSLDRLVRKGALDDLGKQTVLDRIRSTTAYDDLAGVDLVIEAATERRDLKLTHTQAGRGHCWTRRGHCDQHLVDLDHRVGRSPEEVRPIHRNAFFQSEFR